MNNKALHMVSFALVIVGALNWLLVGLFSWDIGQVFGGMSAGISRVIYVLVGLGAVYLLATHGKDCRHCGANKGMTPNAPM